VNVNQSTAVGGNATDKGVHQGSGPSDDPDVRSIQHSLASITATVDKRVKDSKTPDELTKCGDLLKAVAEVEKNLPKSTNIRFFLNRNEAKVLGAYIGGAFLLLLVMSVFGLKPDNLTNGLLYWTTIIAILMGSQALPSITGKGGGGGGKNGSGSTSADASSSKP
jgi:hypothetical protein